MVAAGPGPSGALRISEVGSWSRSLAAGGPIPRARGHGYPGTAFLSGSCRTRRRSGCDAETRSVWQARAGPGQVRDVRGSHICDTGRTSRSHMPLGGTRDRRRRIDGHLGRRLERRPPQGGPADSSQSHTDARIRVRDRGDWSAAHAPRRGFTPGVERRGELPSHCPEVRRTMLMGAARSDRVRDASSHRQCWRALATPASGGARLGHAEAPGGCLRPGQALALQGG
jgi:hypothetical protein